MTNRLLLLIGCSYLFGCTSPEKELENPSDSLVFFKTDTVANIKVESLKDLEGSFQGLGHQYQIVSISQEEFKQMPAAKIADQDKIKEVPCTENIDECYAKTEAFRIQPFAQLVARKGDTLKLKCGAKDSLVNIIDNKSDEDDYVAYKFEHKYSQPDFYFLTTSYYEGRGYKIVNQKTCEVLEISGIPVLSPDRKHAVATNVDLEAGFDFNGIEFLRFEGDKIMIDATQLFEKWGMPKTEWVSNNTLRAIQVRPSSEDTSSEAPQTHFAKILIK